MSTQSNLYKSQSSLCPSSTHNSRSGRHIRIRRNIKLAIDGTLEPLQAIPSHVLNCEHSRVREDGIVHFSLPDDGAVDILNDSWQDGLAGPETCCGRLIGVINEDGLAGTFCPGGVQGGVDCFLDFRSVEVDFCAGWEVVVCPWCA